MKQPSKFMRMSDEHHLLLQLIRHFLRVPFDSRANEAALRTAAEQMTAREVAAGNTDSVQALMGALNAAARFLTGPQPVDGIWYQIRGEGLYRWSPEDGQLHQVPPGLPPLMPTPTRKGA